MKENKKVGPSARGKLMSAKEIDDEYGIEQHWLYDRVEDGTLPFPYFRISPRKLRFYRMDVESWLNAIEHPAGTKPGKIKRR